MQIEGYRIIEQKFHKPLMIFRFHMFYYLFHIDFKPILNKLKMFAHCELNSPSSMITAMNKFFGE